MNKGKIALLATIAALPIAVGTLGYVLYNNNIVNDYAALESLPCNLKLDASNAPDALDNNGNGFDTVSYVEFEYKKAGLAKGNHIVLADGGYIKNSAKPYDETTGIGGFINGIKAITIEYEDILTDPISQTSNVLLNYGHNGVNKSKAIESGERIDFTTESNALPRNFKLSFSYTTSGGGWGAYNPNLNEAYEVSGPHLLVKSILIEANMNEEYSVTPTVTPYNYKDLEFYYDDQYSDFDDINKAKNKDDIKNTQFAKGSIVNFKVKEGAGKAFDETTIDIKDVYGNKVNLVKHPVLKGETFPRYSFVINNDIILNITANIDSNIYEGEEFIGVYTLFDYKYGATKTLDLKANGTYALDKSTGTYTYDKDAGTFKFSNNLEFEFIDNVAYVKYGSTYLIGGIDPDQTGYFENYGTKGNITLSYYYGPNLEEGAILKRYSSIFYLNSKTNAKYVKLDKNHFEIVAGYYGENKDNNILKGYSNAYKDIDELNNPILKERFEIVNNEVKSIANDGLTGKYINNGDYIALDGFGSLKLNNKDVFSYTYDKVKSTITFNNQEYDIDIANKTYKVHVIDVDPWETKQATYTKGYQSLVFNKGNVTINISDYFENPDCKYTINGNIVTFTNTFGDERMTMDGRLASATGEAKFKFELSSDHKTLTSLVTIKADYNIEDSWGEIDGTLTIIEKGNIFTLA